eukprot:scaffold28518_cov131-Isochrysis_galbana.AAC.6
MPPTVCPALRETNGRMRQDTLLSSASERLHPAQYSISPEIRCERRRANQARRRTRSMRSRAPYALCGQHLARADGLPSSDQRQVLPASAAVDATAPMQVRRNQGELVGAELAQLGHQRGQSLIPTVGSLPSQRRVWAGRGVLVLVVAEPDLLHDSVWGRSGGERRRPGGGSRPRLGQPVKNRLLPR